MTNPPSGPTSVYAGSRIVLVTRHRKSEAVAPAFKSILNAEVCELDVDTDQLGTFSGEVERTGTALDTVQRKARMAFDQSDADCALASEGSFGPHPVIPFVPAGREYLFFMDRRRGINTYVTNVFDTNFRTSKVATVEELHEFAAKAGFPSHALIVRSIYRDQLDPMFKGITSPAELKAAFDAVRSQTGARSVAIETDMRAHLNPTRMATLATLGETLARRLLCLCPECQAPGWGQVEVERGLPCSDCGTPTRELKAEIYGCARCDHTAPMPPSHGQRLAEPGRCPRCNP